MKSMKSEKNIRPVQKPLFYHMHLRVFAILSLFLILFSSCANIAENAAESEEKTRDDTRAYLTFSVSAARTVLPDISLDDFTNIYLVGFPKDEASGTYDESTRMQVSFGTYAEMKNAPVYVEPGVWTFSLYAFKDDVIYIATQNDKEIKTGENPIDFKLELFSSGSDGTTGSVSITLNYPSNAGVKAIVAGLYDIENDTLVEGTTKAFSGSGSSKTYTVDSVPIGTYRFKATFYCDDFGVAEINTYREIVRVATNFSSSAERTIENLNEVYSIEYILGEGKFESGFQRESFTRNSAFTLATAADITKDGYAFVGWYENSDYSGERITEIAEGTAGNKTLYAKWATGKVVTASNLSSLSLSSVSDGYTIAVVGDVALKTLASEIKRAGNNINVDLFACTATSLDDELFSGCEKIKSLVLPKDLESIGEKALFGCKNLTSLLIPKNVVAIKSDAFAVCTSLTNFSVHSGNTTFKATDGVLFTADSSEIVAYPAGKAETTYTIPDGTNIVRGGAFYGAASLTSISLPNSLTTIASDAFDDCFALEKFEGLSSNSSFKLIDGVLYSNDETIIIRYPAGNSASSVSIKMTVEKIGDHAFQGNTHITEIQVAKLPVVSTYSLTSIGAYAFANCTSLATFTIPESVTFVGGHAFDGCSGGQFGYVTVTFVTNGADENLDAISVKSGTVASLPNNPTKKGYEFVAWYKEVALATKFNTSSVVTENLTLYADWTAVKYNITYVLGSEGSTTNTNPSAYTIEDNEITLSDPTKTGYKFVAWYEGETECNTIPKGSTGDKTFTAKWWQPEIIFNANGGSIKTSSQKVGYGTATTLFKAAELGLSYSGHYLKGWAKLKDSETPDYSDGGTLTTTESFTLYAVWGEALTADTVSSLNLANLTSPYTIIYGGDIDSSVLNALATKIASASANITLDLSKATGLATISGTYSDGSIFANCSKLVSVILPSSLKTLGVYAFKGCAGLKSVTIPTSVTEIGGSAFYGCTSLASVVLPSSVISIGSYCFYQCSALKSVNIPYGVTEIASSTFVSCSSLSSITIPNSVTSIAGWAFDKCTSLTTVKIPDSVVSIGYWAFRGCTGLKSITFGSGLQKIAYYAFSGCTSLTSASFSSYYWYRTTSSDYTNGIYTYMYYSSTAASNLTTYYKYYWYR